MFRLLQMLAAVTFFMVTPVFAFDYVKNHIPEAQAVGQGRMSVFLWDVYDAKLYAAGGQWQSDKPFALQLNYLLKLDGEKIADRSVEEIRGQGFNDEIKLATWHAQMRKIFPDVEKGMSLTGVRLQSGAAVFYKNGQRIGLINDPAFSAAFFGIWLSEKTSAPNLRKKLLGI